eukprot:jgi/Chlat1/366/Chrsp10S01486
MVQGVVPGEGWALAENKRRRKPPKGRASLVRTEEQEAAELLSRIRRTAGQVEAAPIYASVTAALENDVVVRAGQGGVDLVLYGVGPVATAPRSRCQLALALLLKERLGGVAYIYDPVLEPVELQVAEELGFTLIQEDESCGRAVDRPTLFYMPHCEAHLYDNLLRANWTALERLIVLGNSFNHYHERWDAGFISSKRHYRPDSVLDIWPRTLEVAIDAGNFEVTGAFNDMSLHTFQPEVKVPVANVAA